MMKQTPLTQVDARDNIAQFDAIRIDDPSLRHAAVAIVVLASGNDKYDHSLLLTQRTARLNQHSGQYALPGGKLDEGENVLEAAMREAHEEVGLSLTKDDILGQLDDYPTRSGFKISPVVFWIDSNTDILPSPDEVELIFRIPFSELDSDAIPVFEDGVEQDRPVLASNFPTLGHRMYSPTASIIYQFREVVIRGLSTRVAHFDQPGFAWK